MAETVLVVEDDPSILRGLQLNLSSEGFRVLVARDGEEGLRFAQQHHPALIVLDLMLPKKSGTEVLTELRTTDPDVPVLVLSAKDAEADIVHALSVGADDYLTKPFGVAELIARIRAALRRRRRTQASGGTLGFGHVTLELESRRLLVHGAEVEATAREFDLLRTFLENPGVVFTREQLMRRVWGPDHFGTLRTVDNFVARLRSKIEAVPDEPRHLETVRGVGYRFTPPE